MKKLKIIIPMLMLIQLSISGQEIEKIYDLKSGTNFRIYPGSISQT